MAVHTSGSRYVPGTYPKRRLSAPELADRYVREWNERRVETKPQEPHVQYPPTICISRKLATGAVEIADLVAQRIGYRVVDQQILQHIATQARLSEKTVAVFDERYPGKLCEMVYLAFGEKAFIKSDYTRHLFKCIYAIAALEPTIFVGRGAHLLLPRDTVLAVRIVSSFEFRVQRLMHLMNISREEAVREIHLLDKEQRAFFKEVYDKKDASSDEFDLVVNCDYMKEPRWVAQVIIRAFTEKFGLQEKGLPDYQLSFDSSVLHPAS